MIALDKMVEMADALEDVEIKELAGCVRINFLESLENFVRTTNNFQLTIGWSQLHALLKKVENG